MSQSRAPLMDEQGSGKKGPRQRHTRSLYPLMPCLAPQKKTETPTHNAYKSECLKSTSIGFMLLIVMISHTPSLNCSL